MSERISASEFQKRYGHGHQTRPRVPHAQPAQPAAELEGDHAGEACSAERPTVCFALYRVRLLDADAKYGSIKDLLDSLQYAGLIRGDREEEINLQVEQVRVPHYAEERTEITITIP